MERDDLDLVDEDQIKEVRTPHRVTRFPVPMKGGFGSVEVTLEPGQREVVEGEGYRFAVTRDYAH